MCCLTFLQAYYKGAVDTAIPLSRVAGHLATPATFPDTVKRVDSSHTVDPIILSNGKSFKYSLKSSHSSPHIPGVRLHQHAQSEPAMPAGGPVKNVHFASDESLRTVRVFNASGKPINGSKQQAADDNPSSPDILKRLVSAARPKALR